MKSNQTQVPEETRETEYSSNDPEIQIRLLIKDFKEALLSGDVDSVMSFYAPEVVAFDLVPPIQFIGRDAYRKSWEKALVDMKTKFNESIYEIRNLNISANENLAFSFSLNHWSFKTPDNEEMNLWMRATNCYKKINGKWKITHEQFSVPVDLETGKAFLDLSPDKMLLH